MLGAPAMLQSDNRTEFTANVISELKDFWSALKMVHDKPRHPQSHGPVERANGAWLAENDTQDLVTGIKFVQFHKNSSTIQG